MATTSSDAGVACALLHMAMHALIRAGWAPVLVLGVHGMGLFSVDLYGIIPNFDVYMHLAGGIAIGYFFAVGLTTEHAETVLGTLTRLGRSAMVILLVGMAAIVWELTEWACDVAFGTHYLGHQFDTLGDIIMGLVGGGCVAGATAVRTAPHAPEPVGR